MRHRSILLSAVLLAALVQVATAQNRQRMTPVPLPLECHVSDLVNLAGEIVGDPEVIPDQMECLSTRTVCAVQIKAYEDTKRAITLFRLAHVVKLCRAAGY